MSFPLYVPISTDVQCCKDRLQQARSESSATLSLHPAVLQVPLWQLEAAFHGSGGLCHRRCVRLPADLHLRSPPTKRPLPSMTRPLCPLHSSLKPSCRCRENRSILTCCNMYYCFGQRGCRASASLKTSAGRLLTFSSVYLDPFTPRKGQFAWFCMGRCPAV